MPHTQGSLLAASAAPRASMNATRRAAARVGHVHGGGLDHDPHQRFGAAPSDEDPAVVAQLRLDARDLLGQRRGEVHAGRATRTLCSTCGNRVMAASARSAERSAGTPDGVEQLHRREQPVARGGQIGEDDVAHSAHRPGSGPASASASST